MKYKSFFKQFRECMKNKTAEILELKETEKVYPRPNVQGIKFVEVKRVYFCNKYMKRCSSGICAKERGIVFDKSKK